MTSEPQRTPGEDAGVAARLVLAGLLRGRLEQVGMTEQVAGLDLLGPRHAMGSADPEDLPVLGHLARAVELARADLAPEHGVALSVVAASVAWTQTSAYRHDPPHDTFLDGYAHATYLGPADGGPASTSVPRAALGLLLLAPGVFYPHHVHPADEVYLPLTAARWSHGEAEPLVDEAVGALLRHAPWQPHAMLAGSQPLLAIYLWTGDVTVAADWTRAAGPVVDL